MAWKVLKKIGNLHHFCLSFKTQIWAKLQENTWPTKLTSFHHPNSVRINFLRSDPLDLFLPQASSRRTLPKRLKTALMLLEDTWIKKKKKN